MSSLAPPLFLNRADAGFRLAARLAPLRPLAPVVVAIAPASVEVGASVARALGAPLSTITVELIKPTRGHAVGAAASVGLPVIDTARALSLGIQRAEIESLAAHASASARRRAAALPPVVPLSNRLALVVDDSASPGVGALAAVRAARKLGAARIVLATPVLTSSTAALVRRDVDRIVSVIEAGDPRHPYAWYEDARALSDADAGEVVRRAPSQPPATAAFP